MIELLFALVLGSANLGSGDIDCLFLQDGTKTWEELIIECQEFQDGYVWTPPPYEEDYPHDCTVYQPWEAMAADCDAWLASLRVGSSYIVQDGDLSLWSISQKLGISFGALLDVNPVNPDLIYVGDVINLP